LFEGDKMESIKIRVDKQNVFKFRREMTEEERNELKFENKSLEEITRDYYAGMKTPPQEIDYFNFAGGFLTAKEMIIKFLRTKQIGYGDSYFFKLSEIEEIGDKDDNP
jgi:hypothetical protein